MMESLDLRYVGEYEIEALSDIAGPGAVERVGSDWNLAEFQIGRLDGGFDRHNCILAAGVKGEKLRCGAAPACHSGHKFFLAAFLRLGQNPINACLTDLQSPGDLGALQSFVRQS